MSDVKDQEEFTDPCNSCTAYAVAATFEGTYNRKHNRTGSNRIEFNAFRMFMEAGPAEKCNTSHWWPENALKYCKATGITELSQGNSSTAPRFTITDFQSLIENNLAQTQKNIRNWIMDPNAPGPVVAVMVQFKDFYDFGYDWAAQSPGIPQPAPYVPRSGSGNQIIGGHVVSIVGFDNNPPNNLEPYWLCKNSWGPEWNGDGYVRIAQTKSNRRSCYIDLIDVWGVKV